MRKIKVYYNEINDDNIDNSTMYLYTDYPGYKNRREVFLYELKYFKEIQDFFDKKEEEYIKYDMFNRDFTPFFIHISKECLEELIDYLKNETEREQSLWNNEVSLLNAIIGIYRNDKKMWDV